MTRYICHSTITKEMRINRESGEIQRETMPKLYLVIRQIDEK